MMGQGPEELCEVLGHRVSPETRKQRGCGCTRVYVLVNRVDAGGNEEIM